MLEESLFSTINAPKTASTESNAALVKQILDKNRHGTFGELEVTSGLSRGSLQRIVVQNLEKAKQFIPSQLRRLVSFR